MAPTRGWTRRYPPGLTTPPCCSWGPPPGPSCTSGRGRGRGTGETSAPTSCQTSGTSRVSRLATVKVSTICHRTCCQFFYEYCEKGSNVHLSSSLYGPWMPLAGTNLYCNNPSPWRHTNGSLYLLCSHQGLELSTNLREFSQLEAFTPGTVKLSEGSLTALPGRLPIKIC